MRFLLALLLGVRLWGESISVAVPCYDGHFECLEELLSAYAMQSRVPDEVVISLSGCEKIGEDVLRDFEERKWPFELKVVRHYGKRTEAENRSDACLNAYGDIILTNDADDLPHPERVAVVFYFMKEYPTCKCLIHKWYEGESPPFDMKNISRVFLRNWNDFFQWNMTHSANIAIRKGVINKVRWANVGHAIDRDFLMRCLTIFRKTMMIDAPLIQYRNELSSYNSGDALIR